MVRAGQGLTPSPGATAETVAAYIAECAGRLKVGSIQRRLNAIAEAHKAMGLDSPTAAAMVHNTLKGIRRTLGTAPTQKAAALTNDIRAMVEATDGGLIGARDRALILLGFAGAFRRSELVALDVADCSFGKDGLTLTLRRSTPHQDGAGRKVGIPYMARIPTRAPFARSRRGGSRRLAITCRAVVPLDQSPWPRASGRALAGRCGAGREEAGAAAPRLDAAKVRRTLAQGRACDAAAAVARASERSIMNQTGHRSVQMVRRYIRDGSLFRDNSAGKLGL